MRMYLISDNIDTAIGMRLAGVEGVVVHEKQEVEEAIKTAINDANIGIVLLTEKLSKLIPDYVNHIKLKMPKKLLVEIPDRHGMTKAKDSITSYVNDAIGLKI